MQVDAVDEVDRSDSGNDLRRSRLHSQSRYFPLPKRVSAADFGLDLPTDLADDSSVDASHMRTERVSQRQGAV